MHAPHSWLDRPHARPRAPCPASARRAPQTCPLDPTATTAPARRPTDPAGPLCLLRSQANRPSRGGSDSQPNSQATNPVIRQLETSESEDAADHDPSDDQEPPEDSVPPLSQSGASGGRLSKISSRRLCTEGMLRSLQQEIRKGKRRSVELSFMANQLMIYEPIGRGGGSRPLVQRVTLHSMSAHCVYV